jgi:hypothetical protein
MRREICIRIRRGLVVLPVVVGLAAPATAPAVTVPHAVSVPPTKLGTESAVTVTFAAEGTAELMGTAALEGNSFALAQDTCSDREVTGTGTIEVRVFSAHDRAAWRDLAP